MSSRWIKMSRQEATVLAPYCQYFNPSQKTCYATCQSPNCKHITCCVYCHEYDSCPHGIFCPTFEKRATHPETQLAAPGPGAPLYNPASQNAVSS